MIRISSRFWRTLHLGLKSLLLHKLRSGLTVLGIVCGVGAVIVLLALVEGQSYEAQQQIKLLGANNIIIQSVKPPQDSSKSNRARVLDYGLTYDDYQRILAPDSAGRPVLATITQALPIRRLSKEIVHGHHRLDGTLIGTTPAYAPTVHLELDRGRFFTAIDEADRANVAVIGSNLAKTLFLYKEPLGEWVRAGSNYYRVIGVTRFRAPSGGIGSSLAAEDHNSDMYIPLSTARSHFGKFQVTSRSGSLEFEEIELHQITVTVADTAQVMATSKVLRSMLRTAHAKDDYALTIPLDLLRQAEATQRQWEFMLGSIAGVSLVVGGIGIMNIMLATVTERTREIGVRRALGAKRRDIAYQFLVEAVVLSASGGLLGMAIGVLGARGVFKVFQMLTIVTWWSPVLAFSISLGIGIIFGLYPAVRAARMDPIEALRHE